ncbi:unnamed protein product [Urochloa humidicola]
MEEEEEEPLLDPLAASATGFEETERGIVAVHQYYDGHHLAYGSCPPPPSLFAHDVRDSSGHRLGQPPTPAAQQQQHYWISSTSGGSRSNGHGGGAEELDLELRL